MPMLHPQACIDKQLLASDKDSAILAAHSHTGAIMDKRSFNNLAKAKEEGMPASQRRQVYRPSVICEYCGEEDLVWGQHDRGPRLFMPTKDGDVLHECER